MRRTVTSSEREGPHCAYCGENMTAVRNVALPLLEERGGADALVRYGGEGDGEGVVVLASGRLVPPGADAPLEVASWAHRSGWEIE